ncbi:hypothetical protein D3C86_884060 [compost metagenome]
MVLPAEFKKISNQCCSAAVFNSWTRVGMQVDVLPENSDFLIKKMNIGIIK